MNIKSGNKNQVWWRRLDGHKKKVETCKVFLEGKWEEAFIPAWRSVSAGFLSRKIKGMKTGIRHTVQRHKPAHVWRAAGW